MYQTLLDSNSEEEENGATRNSFSFDNSDSPVNKNVGQKSVKKKKVFIVALALLHYSLILSYFGSHITRITRIICE